MDEHKRRTDDSTQSQNDTEEGAEPKKRARQRKKLLIDRIRLQMEFYFSASNLSKDQFMNKLLKKSPYIDLEVFLKFNRLRALTEDVKLIRKAISKSRILELSDDGTKVKRSSEAATKENEMDCTIYVENIPSHADHEWVHEIFAQYGKIDYISLPHFKSTGRPKGFAFIEFQTPEMTNIALEAFVAIGCKISQDLEPSELQSIKTYETENEQKHTQASEEFEKYRMDTQPNAQHMEDSGSTEKESMGKKKKRKRDEEGSIKSKKAKEGDGESEAAAEATEKPRIKADDESEDMEEKSKQEKESKKRNKAVNDVEKAIKKVRREVEEANTDVTDKNTKASKRKSFDKSEIKDVTKSKKQKVDVSDAVSVDVSDAVSAAIAGSESAAEEEETCGKTKKKKKRKRNKKEKMVAIEGVALKVMSKKEWVRLRNQYLNAQRQNMRLLKDDLHKRKTNESSGSELHQPVKSKQGIPTFTSNAVIKISFEEPPQDPRKLQETIREGGSGGVAYVETSPAEKDVYIRFFSAEAAASYLKAGLWSRMVLLSGNEEKEYWDHCIESWQRSRNKGPKPNKENRGKEKLLQKALREACMRKPSTHITFN